MATLAEPAERDADKVEKAPAPDGNSHPLIRRDAWEFSTRPSTELVEFPHLAFGFGLRRERIAELR